jgi:molybdopterin-guanine dinucleotide biosynthesis protein A
MGRDKAHLEVHGQPLWRLQWSKLRAVFGEVVVCGRASQRAEFEAEQVRFAADTEVDLGPLSGIARALETAHASHVLVLAVDLPRMSERYLLRLWEAAGASYGAVPERAGTFEGLCAVYPVGMLPLVLGRLSGPERSLQSLVRLGLEKRLLRAVPVAEPDLGLFENWNAPGDVAPRMGTGNDFAACAAHSPPDPPQT